MGGKLDLKFSYTFNGKIWNIISHPQKELLLLEVRQHDQFLTTFSLIHTATGEFLLHDIEFEEKWWIGASFITGDLIIFHIYPDQDNPEVKDLMAYDFVKKKVVWKIENENVIDVNAHFISVLSPGGEGMKRYDVLSGKRTEKPAPENVQGKNQNKMQEASFHYPKGSPHFDTVSRFLKQNTGQDIVKGVDYYENARVIVISYYILDENGKLANDLLVMDPEGSHLLNCRLGNALKGISNDTFFVYYNKLIFAKNNIDFLIYQLP